ncbi:hypothetical protein KBC79_00175 [Candidatus Woesebacteria bacterium]|nr:hypothetical protein [Candidatus Woesebacteria bacterium]
MVTVMTPAERAALRWRKIRNTAIVLVFLAWLLVWIMGACSASLQAILVAHDTVVWLEGLFGSVFAAGLIKIVLAIVFIAVAILFMTGLLIIVTLVAAVLLAIVVAFVWLVVAGIFRVLDVIFRPRRPMPPPGHP